ncbi:hypothetical protein ACYQR9_15305 [Methylobacterium sp. CM6241]
MNARNLIVSSFFSIFATGCSTYPLVQDTTGKTTAAIVRHIRCEAREGLKQTVIEWLTSKYYVNTPVYKGRTGADLAANLETDPKFFAAISAGDLQGDAKRYFSFYENSQIAYEFTLDLTESNKDSATLGFNRSFSTRKDTLGIGASSERLRNVQRAFTVVDTFGGLLSKIKESDCIHTPDVNIVYPIVGQLPVGDLLQSYIRINQFDRLGSIKKDNNVQSISGTKTSPAISQMGDTIVFTTTFTGSIAPSFALNPTGMGLLLSSAAFGTEDYRKDKHQVIIVASTSPDAKKVMGQAGGSLYDFDSQRTVNRGKLLNPSINGDLTNSRADFARDTIRDQRLKNTEDAIIQIGNTLSQALR